MPLLKNYQGKRELPWLVPSQAPASVCITGDVYPHFSLSPCLLFPGLSDFHLESCALSSKSPRTLPVSSHLSRVSVTMAPPSLSDEKSDQQVFVKIWVLYHWAAGITSELPPDQAPPHPCPHSKHSCDWKSPKHRITLSALYGVLLVGEPFQRFIPDPSTTGPRGLWVHRKLLSV